MHWLVGRDSDSARAIGQAFDRRDLSRSQARRHVLLYLDNTLFVHDRDPYRLLGLTPDCDMDAIRARHKRMLQVFHPDRHADEQGWFTDRSERLNRAYAYLKANHGKPGSTAIPDAATVTGGPTPSPARPKRPTPPRQPKPRVSRREDLRRRLRARLGNPEHLQQRIYLLLFAVPVLLLLLLYLSSRPSTEVAEPTVVEDQEQSKPATAATEETMAGAEPFSLDGIYDPPVLDETDIASTEHETEEININDDLETTDPETAPQSVAGTNARQRVELPASILSAPAPDHFKTPPYRPNIARIDNETESSPGHIGLPDDRGNANDFVHPDVRLSTITPFAPSEVFESQATAAEPTPETDTPKTHPAEPADTEPAHSEPADTTTDQGTTDTQTASLESTPTETNSRKNASETPDPSDTERTTEQSETQQASTTASSPEPATRPEQPSPIERVNALLNDYQNAYNTSNIDAFTRLFDDEARTKNAGNKTAIRNKYGKLFRETRYQNLALRDISIRPLGSNEYRVKTAFKVEWQYPGGERNSSSGEITIQLITVDGELKITRLDY